MRLAVLVALLCLWAAAAWTQPPGRHYRIGAIVSTERAIQSIRTITVPELARRGFVEGSNMALDAQVADLEHVAAAARELAAQGCLLGYGPSLTEFFRRTADYVARILRGAAASELPIEGPTYVRLALNLRTAKALDLDLPAALLARADDLIE